MLTSFPWATSSRINSKPRSGTSASQKDFDTYKDRIKVDPEHHFIGFDAYKKVLASDIDIVMLATPPGYRPQHFEAAVDAKKHVFCEKPFGVDPVGVQRFMRAAKKSEELKLTVMSGAQRRNAKDYMETVKKIQDGQIGDVVATYAYWVGTPVFPIKSIADRKPNWGEMAWQHRQWYSFVWICGDQIVEQHLHNIDVCNWVMGTHPTECVASGGAAWRKPNEDPEFYGNIYDHISADFVYPNGAHMSSYCRQYPRGSAQNISELIIGTKGRSNAHDLGSGTGQDVRTAFQNQRENPYVREHTAMVASIRGDGPYVNHGHDGGGDHHDLHHGPRGRLLRAEAYLGHDDELQARSAAEGVRLRQEDGYSAAARARRVQIRIALFRAFQVDLCTRLRQRYSKQVAMSHFFGERVD